MMLDANNWKCRYLGLSKEGLLYALDRIEGRCKMSERIVIHNENERNKHKAFIADELKRLITTGGIQP